MHYLLLILSILSFLGSLTGQKNIDIYLVNIELKSDKSDFLKFKNEELIQLPFHQEEIESVKVYNSSIIYFSTMNKRDSTSKLWKYDLQKSSISTELEIKGKIQAFSFSEEGFECVIKKGKDIYILIKKQDESPSMKQIENNLLSILKWNDSERITVDNAHQLSQTDTSYNKYKLLSNDAYNEIYKQNNQSISFIYKFSPDYWYLKEYNFYNNKSKIIVRLPKGVDNYTSTNNGNFLCYDESKVMSYNPIIDLKWQNLSIPFNKTEKNIAWIYFLSDNKMLVALSKD